MDHGCGLHQHHDLQTIRPNSVEPSPQQAVALTKPRSAGPLPMENCHLMSEGQHLQFQRGPTPKAEGDQRKRCGQDRKHAGHDKTVGAKLQCLQRKRNCELMGWCQPPLSKRPQRWARMVEVFDAHGVSFVAVTQQFIYGPLPSARPAKVCTAMIRLHSYIRPLVLGILETAQWALMEIRAPSPQSTPRPRWA